MKKTFRIEGEPFSSRKLHGGKRRIWDKHEQGVFVRKQQLINQQGESPLIMGPFSLDLIFYFTTPFDHPELDDSPCCNASPIKELITFVRSLSEDVIYCKEAHITRLSSRKMYNQTPRTEIYIIKE